MPCPHRRTPAPSWVESYQRISSFILYRLFSHRVFSPHPSHAGNTPPPGRQTPPPPAPAKGTGRRAGSFFFLDRTRPPDPAPCMPSHAVSACRPSCTYLALRPTSARVQLWPETETVRRLGLYCAEPCLRWARALLLLLYYYYYYYYIIIIIKLSLLTLF